MDGVEEGLAVEAHKADSKGSPREVGFSTAREVELLRVGTEVERR